jgi:hypothetical protein
MDVTTSTALGPTSTNVTTTTVFPPTGFLCPPSLVFSLTVYLIDDSCGLTPMNLAPKAPLTTHDPPMLDDLEGGLLYQVDDKAIWWLSASSVEPVALVTVGDGQVELQDVSRLNGRPVAWFTRYTGATPEDALQTLERVTISVGAEPVLVEVLGGWESGGNITTGGDVIAVETSTEGFYTFGIQDLSGNRIDQQWNPYENIDDPYEGCEGCPRGLVVSDDGSRVAYLEPSGEGNQGPPTLVVVELEGPDVVARMELDGYVFPGGAPGVGPAVADIDLIGDLVLLDIEEGSLAHAPIWADLGLSEPVWGELPAPGPGRLLRSLLVAGVDRS